MCEQCGCDTFMPLGQLMAEHDRLLDLDRHVRAALGRGDEATARGLFALLVAILEPHTLAEERGLFAVLRQDPAVANAVSVLAADHVRLQRRIGEAVAAGEDWAARVLAILDRLRDHIRSEEFQLFPRALEVLDRSQWAAVAAIRTTDLTS